AIDDPISKSPETTVEFRSDPAPRPEDELIGIMYATDGWADLDGYPFVVTNPEHWVYAGTNIEEPTTLGHIVGYEWDSVHDDASSPAGLEVLSDSPTINS